MAILASNNKPMILKRTKRVKAMETSDAEIAELMVFADVVNVMNKVLKAARVLAPHSRYHVVLKKEFG